MNRQRPASSRVAAGRCPPWRSIMLTYKIGRGRGRCQEKDPSLARDFADHLLCNMYTYNITLISSETDFARSTKCQCNVDTAMPSVTDLFVVNNGAILDSRGRSGSETSRSSPCATIYDSACSNYINT